MARIRTIKPEFPQSESMGRVSREARLFYVLLWTICDDSGRTRAASRMLASLLYPYDDDAPSLVDGWLAELSDEQCLDLYLIDGTHYLQIRKWLNHQKIDKPTPSKLPEFVESSRILATNSRSLAPRARASLDLDLGVRPRKGSEAKAIGQIPFAEFWSAYPRKVKKKDALMAWPKAAPHAEAILANLAARKLAGQWQDPQFIPHASTYLNGERWNDEIDSPSPPQKFKLSKTGAAYQALGEMIDGLKSTAVVQRSNGGGHPEPRPALITGPARFGAARSDGDDMER